MKENERWKDGEGERERNVRTCWPQRKYDLIFMLDDFINWLSRYFFCYILANGPFFNSKHSAITAPIVACYVFFAFFSFFSKKKASNAIEGIWSVLRSNVIFIAWPLVQKYATHHNVCWRKIVIIKTHDTHSLNHLQTNTEPSIHLPHSNEAAKLTNLFRPKKWFNKCIRFHSHEYERGGAPFHHFTSIQTTSFWAASIFLIRLPLNIFMKHAIFHLSLSVAFISRSPGSFIMGFMYAALWLQPLLLVFSYSYSVHFFFLFAIGCLTYGHCFRTKRFCFIFGWGQIVCLCFANVNF